MLWARRSCARRRAQAEACGYKNNRQPPLRGIFVAAPFMGALRKARDRIGQENCRNRRGIHE